MKNDEGLRAHFGTSIAHENIMVFKDRKEAAEQLAKKLATLKGKNPLVLAVPRGGLPLGEIIAERLEGDLDVVLVHKIGAPGNPEYAIGSVSEFGTIYRTGPSEFGSHSDYINAQARVEIERLKRRRKSYSPVRPPLSAQGRVVVIVDDGIATGSTLLAAVRAIRAQSPQKLIVAAPVTSNNAAELLTPEIDELVVLDIPEHFYAISQFYDSFPQVPDEEAIQILTRSIHKVPSGYKKVAQ